jgi:ferritin
MKRTNKKNAVTAIDLVLEALSKENRNLIEIAKIADRRREQADFAMNQFARQLREEQGEHLKTRCALIELIAKMPASTR